MTASMQRVECQQYPGACYRVVRAFSLDGPIEEPRRRDLLQNLTLTSGIGLYRQARLKARGYNDLITLTAHPTWSDRAGAVVKAIEQRDLATLALIGASYSELLSFFSFSDIAVLDIETLGLTFNFPIILVGVLSLSETGYEARQYLCIDYHLEAPMLSEALSDLSRFSVLVTYNGKAFDVPYVNHRACTYGIAQSLDQVNIDLLTHARRHYRGRVPDCRLATLEQSILGVSRVDDIPGGGVPAAYSRYLEAGDIRHVQPILDHNQQDLQSLFQLFLICLDEM